VRQEAVLEAATTFLRLADEIELGNLLEQLSYVPEPDLPQVPT
jgi:hypothetical protein